jgi:signal transduction histidine kinase
MNLDHRKKDPAPRMRQYRPDVSLIAAVSPVRRWRLLDALLIVALSATIESLVWTGTGPGDPIGGSRPVAALLPLLLALPLWWRRARPLLTCTLVMAGMVAQALISGHAAEGLETVVAAGLASYAVAAYGSRRRALIGLGVVVVGYGVWTGYDRNVRSGRSSELWAASFFALYLLALWLIGAVRQARRESIAAAGRAAVIEREAERAVTEERSRIARDLHDIVSHNLSVVVVQAAGGRARADRGPAETAATLEKIEASGRQALAEMRRLLGVLRTDESADSVAGGLSPTPGVADLESLVSSVREAGISVALDVDDGASRIPAAIGVSVYRIVQEALTNVLKHAGSGAHAEVTVRRCDHDVVVTVVDNGGGPGPDTGLGHGLRGMRERVTLLGGMLAAGGRPTGGFLVTARLPVELPA